MAAKKTAVKQVQEILEDEVIVETPEEVVEDVAPQAYYPAGETAVRLAMLLKRRGFLHYQQSEVIPAVVEYLDSRGYSLDYVGELDEEFCKAVSNVAGSGDANDLRVKGKADAMWRAFTETLERK